MLKMVHTGAVIWVIVGFQALDFVGLPAMLLADQEFCLCLGSGMEDHERIQVELIKAGDETAFESLFRAHYHVLFAFARKFITDEAQAEEVVQELFLGVWEKRHSLNPTVSMRSYLFAAVKNSCLNHLKHLKVREKHQAHSLAQSPDFAQDPQEALQAAELQARITFAIDALPDRCAEIFKLSRFEGLKYQEIADQLGLSVRTIEVQIGKALKILRAQLGPYLPLVLLALLLKEWI